MDYWLDLFTGTTWQEFRKAGAKVSGFRYRRRSMVERIRPGDILLCYSGLLRMSDLLALQPNLDINLYLVAPDERRDKVEQEILRPTFQLRPKPLHRICGYLSFSKLIEKVKGIRKLGLASSLNPEFLKDTAEYFGSEED